LAMDMNCAITVCDREGTIVYMNEPSRELYRKHGNLIGKNLIPCHGERSRGIIRDLLATGGSNVYTIEKKGAPRTSYQPYGPLIQGKGVCLGYAETFRLLMDMAGIECITVTGAAFMSRENHAWNMVKLDGEWYCVDVTWDDTEGGNYDYFNKTDQDYAGTHMRQELSVYLPPCGGQKYRNLEPGSGADNS